MLDHLYRCETWSLTLKEGHRLQVYENWVLRETSGRKRDETMEDWKRLLSGEFHNLYPKPNNI
jgi:hypothetical protein